jgi:hypothetical protein
MRRYARLAVVFGSVVALASGFGVLGVGCSGDDTVVPLDSSADTKPDTTQPDTGTDGGSESSTEGGEDAPADAPLPDVAVPPLDTFIDTAVDTFCTALGACCYQGNPQKWDKPRCINAQFVAAGNPKLLAFRNAATKDGGAGLQYDTAQAKQCLALLTAMPCTITSAQYLAIGNACYGALKGTVPVNSKGCIDSLQCASPGRCDLTVDGGQCLPLLGDGGLCTTSDDCSYRGTYQPPLFCDDDPVRHPDPSSDAGLAIPTCSPQLGPNGSCGNDTDFEGACTTGICGDNNLCGNNFVQNTTDVCNAFTIRDAGAD